MKWNKNEMKWNIILLLNKYYLVKKSIELVCIIWRKIVLFYSNIILIYYDYIIYYKYKLKLQVYI